MGLLHEWPIRELLEDGSNVLRWGPSHERSGVFDDPALRKGMQVARPGAARSESSRPHVFLTLRHLLL
jgi:hypothetical protein